MQDNSQKMVRKFNKYYYSLLILLVLSGGKMLAQSVNIPDTVFVRNDHKMGLVTDYVIHKGNTIYSIARFFNADIFDIYALNKGIDASSLELGDTIVVSFDKKLLKSTHSNKNDRTIPVIYTVKKKETLFRIGRIYFDVDINTVMKLNNMSSSSLEIGQQLKIGFISVGNKDIKINDDNHFVDEVDNKIEHKDTISVKDNVREAEEVDREVMEFKKIVNQNDESKDTLVDDKDFEEELYILVDDSGKAIWNKNSRTKEIFVLHNEAKLNTMMNITNPMYGCSIEAKVVGRIPPNQYHDEVKLVLSPKAASTLMALDSEFYVKFKYKK